MATSSTNTLQQRFPFLFPLNRSFIYLLCFILAIHMFCWPFIVYPTLTDSGPSWLGLDASWQMVLNYADVHHWTWGKDIIFTYGPLGFLSTRYGYGISKWIFVLFDLFIIINFFSVFKDFLSRAQDRFIAAITLIAIILLMGTFYGSGFSWILLFLICYRMYRSYLRPSISSLLPLTILIAISFFIKMNTGLVGIVFLTLHLLNLFLSHKINLVKAVTVLFFQVALIIVLALLLHVSLINYLFSSMELIRGYNQVMYLQEEHDQIEWQIMFLLFAIVALFLIQIVQQIRSKRFSQLLYSFAGLVYIFLLWKQSIVRNDVQHLQEFLLYAPLIFLAGNFFSESVGLSRFFSGSIMVIAITSLLFKAGMTPVNAMGENRFANKQDYVKAVGEFEQHSYFDQRNKRFIPDSLLKKIGNHTIDVFPWDVEYIIQHQMNYAPRPIFQSHMAYTGWLEKKNLEAYEKQAPDFLLYDYDGLDGLQPFNEEVLVNFFISKNYQFADSFVSNERQRVLLQKKLQVVPVHFIPSGETTAGTQEELNLNNSVFIKIHLAYSLRGKLRSTFYKPPVVYISYILENGERHLFKTSIGLLETGMMVDRFINSNADFINYLSSKEKLLPVARIKLELDRKYFDKKMKVEYFNPAR